MSRYNNYGLPSSTKSSNSYNSPSLKNDRHHDERASQSGSEDGSYALYSDAHKIEAELEDESNIALTSQTLNADGTPKRPMNAFMIFARRRRPQVSAENQAMRTGEISKILSKEWVSMPPSEKQFYLEQAKQLKETFNTRYPDYVYRRRPNNSRKRRRSDAGTMRPVDPALLTDQGDDLGGSVDLEASPTDGDDHIEPTLPLPSPFSRPQYSMPQPPVDQAKYGSSHSRGPGHQVSSDPMFRSNGHHDTRSPYGTSGNSDRLGPGLGSTASPRNPVGHGGLHYPYGQPPSHGQSPSIFGTESVTSHQGWPPRVERATPSWLGGGQDRIPTSIASQKQSPYSPASSWSSSNENSSTHSNASPSPNYFPTLNTPFYPNQPQAPPFQSNVSPSSSHSVPPQTSSFEPLSQIQSSSMSRDFTPRGYETSSMSSGSSYPPPPSRDPLSYSQRSLPPVHTGSAYHQPSSSSSSHSHPPPGFWPRD